VHDATLEAVEYLLAMHAVQFVAPAATPVSVIEPAAQSEQYDWPPFDWYLPGSHASHLAALGVDEVCPAGQAMQVCVKLSPYVPGKHLVQKPSNDFAQDCRSPAAHFAQSMQPVCLDAF